MSSWQCSKLPCRSRRFGEHHGPCPCTHDPVMGVVVALVFVVEAILYRQVTSSTQGGALRR